MEARYLVEWTPWSEVTAAAIKRGMPDDGEPGDYVDFASFERGEVCETFESAIACARRVLLLDAWKCPRIRRQILVPNDTDDLGNRVTPMPTFETEATWEVSAGDPDPREEEPDWLAAA